MQSSLLLPELAQTKNRLAHYYLLFCAINSQLKLHDAALIAAKKSNQLFRDSARDLLHVAAKTPLPNTPTPLLQQLSNLPATPARSSLLQLRETTCCLLSVWGNKCSFPNHHLKSTIQKLKHHSIGNVMQMEPLTEIEGHEHWK